MNLLDSECQTLMGLNSRWKPLKCKAAPSNLPPQYFAHNQVYQRLNARFYHDLGRADDKTCGSGWCEGVRLFYTHVHGDQWLISGAGVSITLLVTRFKASNQTACFIQILLWCVALHLICTDDEDNETQDLRFSETVIDVQQKYCGGFYWNAAEIPQLIYIKYTEILQKICNRYVQNKCSRYTEILQICCNTYILAYSRKKKCRKYWNTVQIVQQI